MSGSNDITDITLALSTSPEPIDDTDVDRPCAYCNPNDIVNERKQEAMKAMNETIAEGTHAERPLPAGVVARIDWASDPDHVTIAGHSVNEAMNTVEYTTEANGTVSGHLLDKVTAAPRSLGIVDADYILRFGHEDGAGVEVPVCDMCLDGVPVEHGDQTARAELDYEYLGKGKVGEIVVEESADGKPIHRRVPVNE